MATDCLKNIRIAGIACAVPGEIVKTEDYREQFGEKAVQQYTEFVGIRQRRIADGKTTSSDLCCAAAENLFAELNIDRSQIDALIFVSQTPDYINPATACVLQYRLNLSNECLAYDVNLGCSGYVYGLFIGASHMQAGGIKKVLVLAGDTRSYLASPLDQNQAMMFGDAGSATLLEYDDTAPDTNCILETVGSGFKNMITPCGGFRHRFGNAERTLRDDGAYRSDYDGVMNGADTFRFTISEVPELFNRFFQTFSCGPNSFDFLVLHQANLYIMKNITKRIGMPKDKMLVSNDLYGNVVSATIPITLCNYFGSDNDKGSNKILISGFGIGLSLAVMSIELNPKVCLPIIISDSHFDDGLFEG